MSSPRERAIEALLQRRGISGLFGRPEAVGDVNAIEAVVDLVDRQPAEEPVMDDVSVMCDTGYHERCDGHAGHARPCECGCHS